MGWDLGGGGGGGSFAISLFAEHFRQRNFPFPISHSAAAFSSSAAGALIGNFPFI